jgi:hypothetical protein
MLSYWITHPTESAFISAFSPEGVGQFLMVAEGWPAGRYVIREQRPGERAAGGGPAWGYAHKDVGGDVRIEPVAERPSNRDTCSGT